MQVMALGLVLLFCIAVMVPSCLMGLIFTVLGVMIMKNIHGRQRVVVAVTRALPFFFVSVFVIPLVLALVIVRKTSFPGHCRLPNGYAIMMISPEETGWIYNPKNEETGKSIAWQKEGVDGVKALQIAGRYVLGRRDPRGLPVEVADVNGYFFVDTQTATVTNLSTLPQLQDAASKVSVQVNLESVYDVYCRYGAMRFARFLTVGIVLLSVVFVLLLVRWLLQMRSVPAFSTPQLEMKIS
jgi:hypothetical protein